MPEVDLKAAVVTEYLGLHIINVGEAPVTITHLGWRVGFPWARKYLYQTAPLTAEDDRLPEQLTTGQQAVTELRSYVGQRPGKRLVLPGFGHDQRVD